MHAIERELIDITGYTPRKKFADRQDYLKSILNAVAKLTDDDFENLSDEAAEWANAAVEAHNVKDKDIPDFDQEADPAEDEPDEEDEADDAEGEADEDEPEDESEDGEATEDDEAPHDEHIEGEDEPEEKIKPAKPSKKAPAKAAKADKAPPKKAPAKPAEKSKTKQRKNVDDVVLDKWGAMQGSKNSQALALFEKGATTKEVKDAIGGTYYNILKRAVVAGHKMEKEGAMITLIHKDDMAKRAGGKPTVKKKK